MQPSGRREELLAAVEAELHRLEALCGELERALMRRRWADLDAAIADSRRITHAFQNAMDEAAEFRDADFDRAVFGRLRHVHAVRQNQMTRLQQYHDSVGERLALIARWKSALRSIGKSPARSRLASLDRLT